MTVFLRYFKLAGMSSLLRLSWLFLGGFCLGLNRLQVHVFGDAVRTGGETLGQTANLWLNETRDVVVAALGNLDEEVVYAGQKLGNASCHGAKSRFEGCACRRLVV